MPQQPCPPTEQLQAFLLGQLQEDSIVEISAHLDACPPCEDTIAALEQQSDTILHGLRHGQPRPLADDSHYRQALSFVKQFGRDATVATEEAPPLGNLREYILLEKLGQGGMGTVYKATHSKLDKVVAIKVLPAEKLNDAAAIARFEREMRAVGQLEHPNIVRAMDAGQVDGTHFLVMEYVPGIDLSQLVKQNGPLPIADACELIRQAAIGLDEAFDHGMVHRDIKPSNIMLAGGAGLGTRGSKKSRRKLSPKSRVPNPQVKILDLGLALLDETQSPDTEALTGSGQLMGTLDYMAPEQGSDTHHVDIRADIYSLGATLYKLLTGQAIYHGEQFARPVQKMMALATQPAPPIQELRADIPDELAAIIHRMLEKDPAARFATPDDVADALVPFCNGADLAALTKPKPAVAAPPESNSTTSLLKESGGLDTSANESPSPDPSAGKFVPDITTTATAKPPAATRRKVPAKVLIAGGAGLLGIVALLTAIVFYVQTPNGTLRVEINDPEIEVKIKDSDIVLTNADKEPIQLKAGEHTLIVTRGDFTFETKRFELKKGETTTVKVELLPGKVQVVNAGSVIGEEMIAGEVTAQHALLFADGSYVDFPKLKRYGKGPYTMELWVRPRETPKNRPRTLFGDNLARLELAENKWKSYATAKSGGGIQIYSNDPANYQWTHLAVAYDGTTSRLFVNGHLQKKQGDGTIAQWPEPGFLLGIMGGPDSRFASSAFEGEISEVRFSNVARYEIDFEPPLRFANDEDTKALYHFDEGRGEVLKDSSGNDHHGKIVGAKWVRVDGDGTKLSPIPIDQQPITMLPGQPLGRSLLVTDPAKIEGVDSWTIETTDLRSGAMRARFSPHGELFSVVSVNGVVRVWRAKDQTLLQILCTDAGCDLRWLDDERIEVLQLTGIVSTWKVESGELVGTDRYADEEVERAIFAPTGDLVAVMNGKRSMQILNRATGKQVHAWMLPSDGRAMEWSPNGKRFAVSSPTYSTEGEPILDIWEAGATDVRRVQLQEYSEQPLTFGAAYLAWSHDSNTLKCGLNSNDQAEKSKVLMTLSMVKGIPTFAVPHEPTGGAPNVDFLPGDALLVSGDFHSNQLHVVEAASDKTLRSLECAGDLRRMAISPDGDTLATISEGRTIEFWDVASGEKRGEIMSESRGHGNWVTWTADGLQLAPLGLGIAMPVPWLSNSLAEWANDGSRVVHKSYDAPNLYLVRRDFGPWPTAREPWRSSNAGLVQEFEVHDAAVAKLAFSPDGTNVVSIAEDGAVAVTNIESGEVEHRFDLPLKEGQTVSDVASAIAYASDLLAIVGSDGFMLWSPASGEMVAKLDSKVRAYQIYASPAGEMIVVGGHVGIEAWDLRRQRRIWSQGFGIHNYGRNLAWSEDGSRVTVVDSDDNLRVINALNGRLEKTPARIDAGSFLSRSGRNVCTASAGIQRSIDGDTMRPLNTLIDFSNDQWLQLSPEGNFRASPKLAFDEFRFVVQIGTRQETWTAKEFADRYGWRNDPSQVQIQTGKCDDRPDLIAAKWCNAQGIAIGLEHHESLQGRRLAPLAYSPRQPLPNSPVRLYRVDFGAERSATDDDLSHLAGLVGLKELTATGEGVTDAGLEYLVESHQMTNLILRDAAITGTGLKHLNRMLRLTTLDLSATQLTDEGLKNLPALPELETLNLSATAITDDSVEKLSTYTALRALNIRNTKISSEGAEQLRKALPECRLAY